MGVVREPEFLPDWYRRRLARARRRRGLLARVAVAAVAACLAAAFWPEPTPADAAAGEVIDAPAPSSDVPPLTQAGSR
jgi:hypothetical protein